MRTSILVGLVLLAACSGGSTAIRTDSDAGVRVIARVGRDTVYDATLVSGRTCGLVSVQGKGAVVARSATDSATWNGELGDGGTVQVLVRAGAVSVSGGGPGCP